MGFKSGSDHFMIIQGKKAVVGIRPDPDYMASKQEQAAASGKEYNPSKDNALMYNVVGFEQDKRIDNLLIPMPEEEDFEKSHDPKGEYAAAVADINRRRNMMINPDAPATKISGKRGGLPFGRDPNDNIMNRIKVVTGGINAIYTVSESGVDDETPMSHRDRTDFIDTHQPSVVQKGVDAWPRVSGVDRQKIARRNPSAPKSTYNAEFKKIVNRISPVFPSLIKQAESVITKRARKFAKGDDAKAMEQINKAKKALQHFKISATGPGDIEMKGPGNPVVAVIGGAILQLGDLTKLNSPEGIAYMQELNGQGSATMGPLLDMIRSKLEAIAS